VANQLAIYKRSRGFEVGATVKQIQVLIRAELEPKTTISTSESGNVEISHEFLLCPRCVKHFADRRTAVQQCCEKPRENRTRDGSSVRE